MPNQQRSLESILGELGKVLDAKLGTALAGSTVIAGKSEPAVEDTAKADAEKAAKQAAKIAKEKAASKAAEEKKRKEIAEANAKAKAAAEGTNLQSNDGDNDIDGMLDAPENPKATKEDLKKLIQVSSKKSTTAIPKIKKALLASDYAVISEIPVEAVGEFYATALAIALAEGVTMEDLE